jgi:hypothetical protein
MGHLSNRTVNSVSIKGLDLRLAQIAESVARELQMEKGVQQGAKNMANNKRLEGSDQIKQVDERGITSDSPGGANKAKRSRAARRRLKRAREEGKASLREGKGLAKKDKSKFKHKSKKDRKAKTKKKKKFSEMVADIDDHPEDVSMLDVNTPGEDMKGSANSNDHMFAVKETRIIPVKVGRFWRYPTVNSVESKRDESSTESNEPPIESNKSPVRSNESSIEDSKSSIEINKIPIESIESNALSRFSTMVLRKRGAGSSPEIGSKEGASRKKRHGQRHRRNRHADSY